MPIKHLVISGGGTSGLLTYGVASQLALKGFWHLSDIQSMYGCSIGAYLCVLFSLGYAWDWLDDYLIKRPWEKLLAASMTPLMDIYEKKCLVKDHFFIEAIAPLLRAKDLSETLTLSELYAYNSIDIHLYAANINADNLEKIDLSHKTHPDLTVVKALRMTMAFPVIFEPICDASGCYIDGGIMNNFPLNDCIDQQVADPDEILALQTIWKNTNEEQRITTESSIFDFLLMLLRKMEAVIDTQARQKETKYTVKCILTDLGSFDKWAEALKSAEMRKGIIEDGYAQADAFLQTLAAAAATLASAELVSAELASAELASAELASAELASAELVPATLATAMPAAFLNFTVPGPGVY
jgi:predicted acylesterase/phospholipase RssA